MSALAALRKKVPVLSAPKEIIRPKKVFQPITIDPEVEALALLFPLVQKSLDAIHRFPDNNPRMILSIIQQFNKSYRKQSETDSRLTSIFKKVDQIISEKRRIEKQIKEKYRTDAIELSLLANKKQLSERNQEKNSKLAAVDADVELQIGLEDLGEENNEDQGERQQRMRQEKIDEIERDYRTSSYLLNAQIRKAEENLERLKYEEHQEVEHQINAFMDSNKSIINKLLDNMDEIDILANLIVETRQLNAAINQFLEGPVVSAADQAYVQRLLANIAEEQKKIETRRKKVSLTAIKQIVKAPVPFNDRLQQAKGIRAEQLAEQLAFEEEKREAVQAEKRVVHERIRNVEEGEEEGEEEFEDHEEEPEVLEGADVIENLDIGEDGERKGKKKEEEEEEKSDEEEEEQSDEEEEQSDEEEAVEEEKEVIEIPEDSSYYTEAEKLVRGISFSLHGMSPEIERAIQKEQFSLYAKVNSFRDLIAKYNQSVETPFVEKYYPGMKDQIMVMLVRCYNKKPISPQFSIYQLVRLTDEQRMILKKYLSEVPELKVITRMRTAVQPRSEERKKLETIKSSSSLTNANKIIIGRSVLSEGEELNKNKITKEMEKLIADKEIVERTEYEFEVRGEELARFLPALFRSKLMEHHSVLKSLPDSMKKSYFFSTLTVEQYIFMKLYMGSEDTKEEFEHTWRWMNVASLWTDRVVNGIIPAASLSEAISLFYNQDSHSASVIELTYELLDSELSQSFRDRYFKEKKPFSKEEFAKFQQKVPESLSKLLPKCQYVLLQWVRHSFQQRFGVFYPFYGGVQDYLVIDELYKKLMPDTNGRPPSVSMAQIGEGLKALPKEYPNRKIIKQTMVILLEHKYSKEIAVEHSVAPSELASVKFSLADLLGRLVKITDPETLASSYESIYGQFKSMIPNESEYPISSNEFANVLKKHMKDREENRLSTEKCASFFSNYILKKTKKRSVLITQTLREMKKLIKAEEKKTHPFIGPEYASRVEYSRNQIDNQLAELIANQKPNEDEIRLVHYLIYEKVSMDIKDKLNELRAQADKELFESGTHSDTDRLHLPEQYLQKYLEEISTLSPVFHVQNAKKAIVPDARYVHELFRRMIPIHQPTSITMAITEARPAKRLLLSSEMAKLGLSIVIYGLPSEIPSEYCARRWDNLSIDAPNVAYEPSLYFLNELINRNIVIGEVQAVEDRVTNRPVRFEPKPILINKGERESVFEARARADEESAFQIMQSDLMEKMRENERNQPITQKVFVTPSRDWMIRFGIRTEQAKINRYVHTPSSNECDHIINVLENERIQKLIPNIFVRPSRNGTPVPDRFSFVSMAHTLPQVSSEIDQLEKEQTALNSTGAFLRPLYQNRLAYRKMEKMFLEENWRRPRLELLRMVLQQPTTPFVANGITYEFGKISKKETEFSINYITNEGTKNKSIMIPVYSIEGFDTNNVAQMIGPAFMDLQERHASTLGMYLGVEENHAFMGTSNREEQYECVKCHEVQEGYRSTLFHQKNATLQWVCKKCVLNGKYNPSQ